MLDSTEKGARLQANWRDVFFVVFFIVVVAFFAWEAVGPGKTEPLLGDGD